MIHGKRVLAMALVLSLLGSNLPWTAAATELTASVEVTQPVVIEATLPEVTTEPTQPAETTEPTQPAETTEPTQPAETTEPTQPEETTEPTQPEETTEPTQPEETTEPTQPEETTEPTQPEETTEPTTPMEGTVDSAETTTDAMNAVVGSGKCGDNVFWSYNSNGELRITGYGPMEDYSDDDYAPWDYYGIKKVVIESGVTSIGNNAFAYLEDASIYSVTIPSTVTRIGDWAFAGCEILTQITIPASVTELGVGAFAESGLTSVTIPSGVKHISNQLFNGCAYLSEVTLPDGLLTIGEYAFFDCELGAIDLPDSLTTIKSHAFGLCGLQSVRLGQNVSSIEPNAFFMCESLQGIKVSSSNAYYCADSYGVLYNKEKTELLAVPATLAGSYTIATGVQEIHGGMFQNLYFLTAIIIPDTVTKIGEFAFYGCSRLAEVEMPDSITALGQYAFATCGKLSNVKLSSKLTRIEACTFWGCALLDYIAIPEGVTYIGESAFSGCELWEISLPVTLEEIGDCAFNDCQELGYIYYSGSKAQWDKIKIGSWNEYLEYAHLITIETGSGTCGDHLTWVLDRDGVLTISGTGAMYNYSTEERPWDFGRNSIKKVVIEDGVTAVGTRAFLDCDCLTQVQFGKSVSGVDGTAFIGCNWLESFTVAAGSPYLRTGDYGVLFTKDMKTLIAAPKSNYDYYYVDYKVPYGVETIGAYAFENCRWLETVFIPGSVKTIEESAFEYCSEMYAVTMDNGVEDIGARAFYECWCLETIELSSGLKYIGRGAFEYCESLMYMVIPEGVLVIDEYAFAYCEYLQAVTLPESLNRINDYAFYDTDLWGVFYYGTQSQFNNIAILDSRIMNAEIHCDIEYIDKKGGVYYCEDCGRYYYPNGYAAEIKYSKLSTPRIYTDVPYLVWDSIYGADYYEIWRATSKNGTYKKIATTYSYYYDASQSSGGGTRYFKVKAIYQDNKNFNSSFSNVVSLTLKCAKPYLYGSYDADSGGAHLYWDAVGGAKKYDIYRKTYGGTFRKIASTTKTSYIDAKGSAGTIYYYYIRAIASNSKYNSEDSRIIYGYHICARPNVKITLDAKTGKPTLSWNKVSGASYYKIYCDAYGDEEIAVTKTTTFRDDMAPIDVEQTYYVQACGVYDDCDSYYSKAKSITPVCARPSVKYTFTSDNLPKIYWDEVPGAYAYNVYRSSKSGSGYTRVCKGTEELSFIDGGIAAGKTYYYKVTAVSPAGKESAQSSYVTVTGKCATPANLTAKTGTSGKPELKWGKVNGAKKYEIRYSNDGGVTFAKKTLTTTKNYYTHTAAEGGKEYVYQVRALGAKSAHNGFYCASSEPCYVTCAAPQLSVKLNASTGTPVLTWKAVAGAMGYAIYRSVNGGEFDRLDTAYGTRYDDLDVSVDNQYSYKVASLGIEPIFNSVQSSAKTVTVAYGQPVLTVKVNEDGKPVLSWNEVGEDLTYEIYYSTKSNKSYKPLVKVQGCTYTHTSVAAGKTYYYKVRAVGENSNSPYSTYAKGTGKCAQPKNLQVEVDEATGQPKLTWNTVSGAKKYEIRYSTNGGATYAKKTLTTTKTYFIHTGAKVGTTYTYQVRAVAAKSSYNGQYTQAVSETAYCARPAVTVANDAATGQPKLSWKQISGAVSYEIIRIVNGVEEDATITVSTTGYKDSAAEVGTAYGYKVRAIGANGEFAGAYGQSKTITAACAQPAKPTAALWGTGKPVITWETVEGATGYAVYRSTKSGSGYQKIGNAKPGECSYSDAKASKGKTYYYKVVALTGNVASAQSGYVKIKSK